MKRYQLNHQGLALPYVIGLVTFFIAITVTLMLYATAQTRLIQNDIETSESYYQAKEKVEATLQIIIRDETITSDYLTGLSITMGVMITEVQTNVWQVSAEYDSESTLSSFLAIDVETINVVNDQLVYTGFEEDYVPNDFFTAFNLLNTYLPMYLAEYFPTLTPPEFSSIDDMFSYIKSLPDSQYDEVTPKSITNMRTPTISDHAYVTGSITNLRKDLDVTEGILAFIDGSLSLRGGYDLTGNMVIDGNFTLNSGSSFIGTIYVDGDVIINGTVSLGTSTHPAFIIATGSITSSWGDSISGYGYLIGDSVDSFLSSYDFEGGIYPEETGLWSSYDLTPNTEITSEDLFAYALPISVAEDPVPGEISFVYTSPK